MKVRSRKHSVWQTSWWRIQPSISASNRLPPRWVLPIKSHYTTATAVSRPPWLSAPDVRASLNLLASIYFSTVFCCLPSAVQCPLLLPPLTWSCLALGASGCRRCCSCRRTAPGWWPPGPCAEPSPRGWAQTRPWQCACRIKRTVWGRNAGLLLTVHSNTAEVRLAGSNSPSSKTCKDDENAASLRNGITTSTTTLWDRPSWENWGVRTSFKHFGPALL